MALATLLVVRRHAGDFQVTDDDELLRARLRRVVRDFFQDKPPGTTIEQSDLDRYHRQLREVVEEHRSRLSATRDVGRR